MKDNFENRTRTTCAECYNIDRGDRRSMDLIHTKPLGCEICKTERELFPGQEVGCVLGVTLQ